jgi:hemerythrin-like metal-binding protein
MPQFRWDSTYSVKVKRFDDEHQELFRIVNQLYDGMMARRGQQVLQTVLNDLLQYTEKHFAAEEQVMRSVGYPQLQAQIEQHRRFSEKIKELTTKYKAGSIGMTIEVLDLLTEWLKKHIKGMDKQYSAFLNSKGIA